MDSLAFKFKWLDDKGNEQGFRSKKASFDGDTLLLDDTKIPVATITNVDYRAKKMVVAAATGDGQPASLLFSVTSGSPQKIKEALGLARSAAQARLHREELEKKGLGDTFYQVQCPHCQATIDLTGKQVTPQVSCEFCHSVGTLESDLAADGSNGAVPAERQYRLCDECSMYSKPRQFTIFYFYFLVVFYGFSSRTVWRCPACMRPEAWKMFFGNFLFVLGIPVALVQLFRSYGGSNIGSLYAGLDSANMKARKGNLPGAVKGYQAILAKRPTAAGVKYNIGLALLRQNDVQAAASMFEYTLNDCSNYTPAASALAGCYTQLGETEKLAELKRQWDAQGDDGAEGEAPSENPQSPTA